MLYKALAQRNGEHRSSLPTFYPTRKEHSADPIYIWQASFLVATCRFTDAGLRSECYL